MLRSARSRWSLSRLRIRLLAGKMLVGDHFRSVLCGEGVFLWSEHVVMVSVGLGPALQAIAEVKGANCLSS